MDSSNFARTEPAVPDISAIIQRMCDAYTGMSASNLIKFSLLLTMSVILIMILLNISWHVWVLIVVFMLLRLLYIALLEKDKSKCPLDPEKIKRFKDVYKYWDIGQTHSAGEPKHPGVVPSKDDGPGEVHKSDKPTGDVGSRDSITSRIRSAVPDISQISRTVPGS